MTTESIKEKLKISKVLKYYGAKAYKEGIGMWWCPLHEKGGKTTGHKTPSLVAKDERGLATCMSKMCFDGDDVFGIIKKLNEIDEFTRIKEVAIKILNDNEESTLKNNQEDKNQELKAIHIEYLKSIGIETETAEKHMLKAKGKYIMYPQVKDQKIIGYKGISIKTKNDEKSKFSFEGEKSDIWIETNIKDNTHLIIVEGEKDAMRLSQEIKNEELSNKFSIITLTTGAISIGKNVKNTIKKYSIKNISIIYDNDLSGNTGAKKLYEELKNENYNLEILSFKDYKKEGYDISTYFDQGYKLKNLLSLPKIKIKNPENSENIKNEPENIYPERKKNISVCFASDIVFTNDDYVDCLNSGSKSYSSGFSIGRCSLYIPGPGITVIAAPTSHGKTLFMSNVAMNIIHKNPEVKILYLSLEESKVDIVSKFINLYCEELFSAANVNYIKNLILSSYDSDSLTIQECKFLKKKDFFFNSILNKNLYIDCPDLSFDSLNDYLEFYVESYGINLLFLDYVQLIRSITDGSYSSRTFGMKSICHVLNRFSIKYSIPIVAASQFNRRVVTKEDMALVNISESGDIERFASVVLSLWKGKHTGDSSSFDSLLVRVLKNRNGISGIESLFRIDCNLQNICVDIDYLLQSTSSYSHKAPRVF